MSSLRIKSMKQISIIQDCHKVKQSDLDPGVLEAVLDGHPLSVNRSIEGELVECS